MPIYERYNRTLCYEWLAGDGFESIAKEQETATQWLWIYNNERRYIILLTVCDQLNE
jgi:putative transposase